MSDNSSQQSQSHSEHRDQHSSSSPNASFSISDYFPYTTSIIKELEYDSDKIQFLPVNSVSNALALWIGKIRDEHCHMAAYDSNMRASYGLLLTSTEFGTQISNFLQTDVFNSIDICSPHRSSRHQLQHNINACYLSSKVHVHPVDFQSFIKYDYKYHCASAPVFIDLYYMYHTHSSSLTMDSTDGVILYNRSLNDLVSLLFSNDCPLILFRVDKKHQSLFEQFNTTEYRVVEKEEQMEHDCIYYGCFSMGISHVQLLEDFHGNPTVISQKQFMTLYQKHNDTNRLKERLETLIKKQVDFNESLKQQMLQIIQRCIHSEKEEERYDHFIYTQLYHFCLKELYHMDPMSIRHQEAIIDTSTIPKTETEIHSYKRNLSRRNDLTKLIPNDGSVHDYLDIGCSDGETTIAVGEYLHLSPSHIHGCDIRDLSNNVTTSFTFKYYDGYTLPYEDNSIDLITCLMVLHHIRDIEHYITEIYRVLKPNGRFILREHDCSPNELSLFFDIQHGLYALVWKKDQETPDFCNSFLTYYKSRVEWTKLFYSIGFSRCMYNQQIQYLYYQSDVNYFERVDYIKNVARPFYAVFQKDDGRRRRDHRLPFEESPEYINETENATTDYYRDVQPGSLHYTTYPSTSESSYSRGKRSSYNSDSYTGKRYKQDYYRPHDDYYRRDRDQHRYDDYDRRENDYHSVRYRRDYRR